MGDVTQILEQIEDGDGQAAEKLLPLVYDELRKLSAAKMVKEDPGQTLQATSLVHEAYKELGDTAAANRSHRAAQEVLENIPRETPDELFELARAVQANLSSEERKICGHYGRLGLWPLVREFLERNVRFRQVNRGNGDGEFSAAIPV